MAHTQTISCVRKAELLLADDSHDSLRYATLQLRMGIEYLFYELIPLYKEELPDDITSTKWQPQKTIDALLHCDPDADKDGRLAVGPSGAVGQPGAATLIMEIKSPNKRMLRDHYHRLGSYLHAPVGLVDADTHKWHSDLETTINCLKQFKGNQVLCNIRALVEIPCK